jgi:hypothetical protein
LQILAEFFAFPTAIFTLLLALSLLYWLFVILGALDIDMLDFGEAAEGMIDGAAEGAAEGAFEGIAEGAAEAGAEGVAEGAAEAGAGLLSALKLRSAPATVVFSFIVLFAWAVSFMSVRAVAGWGLTGALVGLGIMVVAIMLALPLASIAIRPLAPVFRPAHARTRADLLGQFCVISTQKVTDRFGQANCHLGGDDLLIQVRAAEFNTLSKGKQALIIDYDREREAYLVEPLGERKAGL